MSIPVVLAQQTRNLGHDLLPEPRITDTADIYSCTWCGSQLAVDGLCRGSGTALTDNCSERLGAFIRGLDSV